jgi:NNP family nitrate/nitrite transporter-like MFS transporter
MTRDDRDELVALLRAGNGAVLQLVGLRFADEIGIVTGVVGAAGGFGGFFLPSGSGHSGT